MINLQKVKTDIHDGAMGVKGALRNPIAIWTGRIIIAVAVILIILDIYWYVRGNDTISGTIRDWSRSKFYVFTWLGCPLADDRRPPVLSEGPAPPHAPPDRPAAGALAAPAAGGFDGTAGGFGGPTAGGLDGPTAGGFDGPTAGGFAGPTAGGFDGPAGGFDGPAGGFDGPSVWVTASLYITVRGRGGASV